MKKCKCGMPLDENTSCKCDSDVCIHCCKCAPDCECGCQEKSKKANEGEK